MPVSDKPNVRKNVINVLIVATRKIIFKPYISHQDPIIRGANDVPMNSPVAIPIAVVVAAMEGGTDS